MKPKNRQSKKLERIKKFAPKTAVIEATVKVSKPEDDSVPSFEIVAYDGGIIKGAGKFPYPVVIDLQGASFEKETTKIYRDHDIKRPLGHTETQQIRATDILIAGLFSVPGEERDEVLEANGNGFEWEASIGASFQPEFIARGKTVHVNGRSFDGPVYVGRSAVINEITITSRGANRGTQVAIAAQDELDPSKESEMNLTPEQTSRIEAMGFTVDELSDDQIKSLLASMSQPEPNVIDTADIAATAAKAATDAALQVELRVGEIRAAVETFGNPTMKVNDKEQTLMAHALENDWDVNTVNLHGRLNDLETKSGGGGPAIHVSTRDYNEELGQAIQASTMLNAAGLSEEFVGKHYDEATMNRAMDRENRVTGFHDLMRICIDAAGMHYHGSYKDPEFIRTAFRATQQLEASTGGSSTMGLTNVFENTMNKSMLSSFTGLDTTWREICSTGSASDFRKLNRYRVTADGGIQKIGSDGELKHVGLQDSKRQSSIESWGAMMTVTRKNFINDDMGALTGVAEKFGRMYATLIEEEVYKLILAAQTSGYVSAPKSYFDGAGSALQVSSLTTAKQKFRNRVDANGKPILVNPSILLCGVTLEDTALSLYKDQMFGISDTSAGGKRRGERLKNEHFNKYRPVVTPYLDNTDITDQNGLAITGQSATVWYLLSDPRVLAAYEVIFLNGKQAPTIETGELSFERLGMGWRHYMDFGANTADVEGIVMSKGAA